MSFWKRALKVASRGRYGLHPALGLSIICVCPFSALSVVECYSVQQGLLIITLNADDLKWGLSVGRD